MVYWKRFHRRPREKSDECERCVCMYSLYFCLLEVVFCRLRRAGVPYESHHTYEGVMRHMWMSHVTFVMSRDTNCCSGHVMPEMMRLCYLVGLSICVSVCVWQSICALQCVAENMRVTVCFTGRGLHHLTASWVWRLPRCVCLSESTHVLQSMRVLQSICLSKLVAFVVYHCVCAYWPCHSAPFRRADVRVAVYCSEYERCLVFHTKTPCDIAPFRRVNVCVAVDLYVAANHVLFGRVVVTWRALVVGIYENVVVNVCVAVNMCVAVHMCVAAQHTGFSGMSVPHGIHV